MSIDKSKTLIGPEEGVYLPTLDMVHKVTAELSGGSLTVEEWALPPGGLIPPHTHTREDECSFVLEGELTPAGVRGREDAAFVHDKRKETSMSTPTLETERLVLRPLARDDLAAMRRICNEPDVGRYLCDGEPVSTETVKTWLDRSARDFSEKGIGLFGLRPRGAKELIGFCGFFTFEEGGVGEPELTYGLLPAWWRRGLAIEASQACVRYAFEEASFEQVLAGADAVNVASLRVIDKLGMSYVGQIDSSAPDVPYFALTGRISHAAGVVGEGRGSARRKTKR